MRYPTTTFKSYSTDYTQLTTYLLAIIFVIGNVALPQLCHQFAFGGPRWLPIYFFTLIGAYKYGWRVGALTAIVSPLVNCALFGMPPVAMLPVILLKSLLLAGAAAAAASRFRKASLPLLFGVVAAYQLPGTLGEWAITGSLAVALQDLTIGLPGMLLQVVGGWAVLNTLLRR